MSDRQLRTQHADVVARNREQRLATMAEAQRQADQRRERAASLQAGRDAGDEM
ncbi:hypothetical protein Aca07nite_27780 [Actinoplanes capillaceus]|uniref:Uncharacterized protein n=1 Tax=Actinoplanes campanulatus TaxID=113559 RepID=A0ABQ3WGZ3_9ACTN|nr:hypothetical protein [Actinoplanes capillaceus]GID45503.1 hypothetical protein Aca07nite_27780 [Actinoplanes capillaceus]